MSDNVDGFGAGHLTGEGLDDRRTEGQMQVGTGDRRKFRRSGWAVVAAGGAAVALLAACTSSSNGPGKNSPAAHNGSLSASSHSSAPSSAPATSPSSQPAVLTTSAHGVISPATPVTVDIANGKLTSVSMVNL